MSGRPYVDEPVTDVDGAARAATDAARRWGLDAPVLMRRGMNAIFRCSDVVLRVSTPTAPAVVSLELAAVLADHGVRVPASVRDDVFGGDGFAVTAWDHVTPSGAPVDWASVGSMVARVQRIDRSDLPAALPQPSSIDLPWWHHDRLLADVVEAGGVADRIDATARDGLRSAIERHRGWDDFVDSRDNVVCHGDVHPGNVIMAADGPVLLDWDLLCIAPPAWDHAALMTWSDRWGGDADLYTAFAGGFGWSAHGDRHGDAFAELRLVSATLMRWKAALIDPAARPEAERRLAYWRGDTAAPMWQAQ